MATILSSISSENRDDCPYLESLGLRHSPFTEDDESAGYLDERGGQHLNLATHLLESSHMIVIVLGEQGMGKSTLARQLQIRLPDMIQPCLINAKNLTPQSLLRSMAGRLDIPQDVDLPTQRLLLAEKTVSLRHQDCVPLLLVDDAHLLDDATLAALLQIHTGTDQEYNRWELAMFSNPGLEQRVAAQLVTGKENLYEIQLKPYNDSQVRDYLASRMKTAGYTSNDLPFTDRQFKLILEKSNGIPARINDAAHELLCNRNNPVTATPITEPEHVRQAHQIRFPAVKLQRILLLLSIALLAGILVFQDKINQLFVKEYDAISGPALTPTESTTAPSQAESIKPDSVKPITIKPESSKPDATSTAANRVTSTPQPAPETASEQKQAAPVEELDPFEPVARTDIPKLTLPQIEHQTGTTATQQAESPESEQPKAMDPLQTQPAAGKAEIAAPVKAAPGADTKQARHAPITEPASQVTKPKQTEASVEHSQAAMTGQQWVMSLNPKHYTIQLLATSGEAHVQRYINKHQMSGHVYYYPIRHRDRLLYVLLNGDFADRASAQAAMAQLPADVRKDKPWLRALSLIQAEIKRGHK